MPRVLVIGDSVSVGYFPWLQKDMEGQAILIHNQGNAGNSWSTMVSVDGYLQAVPNPDLVAWNNGLHDLTYYNKELGRNLDHTEVLQDYKSYLKAIGEQLLASGARVIFFTTTDIPPKEPSRHVDDLSAYNDAARAVMHELGIPVYDLGGFSQKLRDYHIDADQQNNVHYRPEGYQLLAQFAASSIRTELMYWRLNRLLDMFRGCDTANFATAVKQDVRANSIPLSLTGREASPGRDPGLLQASVAAAVRGQFTVLSILSTFPFNSDFMDGNISRFCLDRTFIFRMGVKPVFLARIDFYDNAGRFMPSTIR